MPSNDRACTRGIWDFPTNAFPLLTRLNGWPLEKVFELQEIEQLRHIDADEINRYLWYLDGRTRDGQLDNPSSKSAFPKELSCNLNSLMCDCYVSPSGELRLKIYTCFHYHLAVILWTGDILDLSLSRELGLHTICLSNQDERPLRKAVANPSPQAS